MSNFSTGSSESSHPPEHRRKRNHHERGPHGIDQYRVGLPALELGEGAAAAEEAEVEQGGLGEVDEQKHILAERGEVLGAEALSLRFGAHSSGDAFRAHALGVEHLRRHAQPFILFI